MRPFVALVSVLAVYMAAATPASAQGVPDDSVKGQLFTGLNFLAGTGPGDFDARVNYEVYGEAAEIVTQQDIGSMGTFDIGGAYGITRRILVGISYSRASSSAGATVNGNIPHPQLREEPRPFTTSVGDLSRTEQGIHLVAAYYLPLRPNMDLTVSLGPSIFTLEQGVASSVTFTEASGTGFGFNIGADFSYMFTPRFGAGVLLRYARASVDLDIEGGSTVESDAGGFQAGVGLRVRF
jgi:hypothetical protein